MKLSLLYFAFNLAVGAFCDSTPLIKRTPAEYEVLFTAIDNQVQELENNIISYSTGTASDTDVLTSANALVNAFNDATDTIVGLENLTVNGALTLATPFIAMRDDFLDMMDSLMATKAYFIAYGVKDDIVVFLYDLRTATQGFCTWFLYKIPDPLLNSFGGFCDDIMDAVQYGLELYTY